MAFEKEIHYWTRRVAEHRVAGRIKEEEFAATMLRDLTAFAEKYYQRIATKEGEPRGRKPFAAGSSE